MALILSTRNERDEVAYTIKEDGLGIPSMAAGAKDRCLRLSLKLPCQLPKRGFRSQQQPSRLIEEVLEM
jgi:hypothetical protein